MNYNELTQITHDWVFWLPIIAVLSIFIVSWGALGLFKKGRSANGQRSSKPMGASSNYWIMTFVIVITFAIISYFIFFPIHLKLLN